MDAQEPGQALLRVAAAFVIAVMLSPVVRSVTAGLDGTLGQAWPFSLTRCHVSATPGCDEAGPPRLHASR
jgi:hypothetical protein